jgi:IPT/TIG domain
MPIVGDPWKPKYNPMQLPARTVAAQTYPAEAVDATIPMTAQQVTQATLAIGQHWDDLNQGLAAIGPDPRLAGTGASTLTSVAPTSGAKGSAVAITLTGTNLTGTTAVALAGTPCTSVSVTNATTVTAVTPTTPNKGPHILTATVGTTSCTGPTYTVT